MQVLWVQGSALIQEGLQPTPRDPKLWLVQCNAGSEREAVICLLQKSRNLANTATPLFFKSAFCLDHLKVIIITLF